MAHLKLRSSKRKFDQEENDDESTSSTAKEMKTSAEILEKALISDAAGMGVFHNLNQDVFEEIVSFLDTKDILKFCLTSKTMNGLIGNNEKIMRRITLQFPKLFELDYMTENDFGQRIYRKIAFKNNIIITELPIVSPYIKKISSHVNDIEIDSNLSFTVGVYIIKHFKASNKIRANFKGNILRSASSTTALDVQHLKALEINNCWKNFFLFENCQLLEKLSLSNTLEFDEAGAPRFQQFLLKQSRLKSLNVGRFLELFNDSTLTDSKFKLEEFSFEGNFPNISSDTKANLQNFLKLHSDTLEKLSLTNATILEFTRYFPRLKTVELTLYGFEYPKSILVLKEMPFVKTLSVKASFYDRFNLSTSSVKDHLNLKEFRGGSLIWNSSLSHGRIEKLFLEFCSFSKFDMPNLQSATFRDVTFPPDTQLNHKIKELSLCRCTNTENLLAFIDNADAKLQRLELVSVTLSNRRLIDANLHKIRKLITKNVTYLINWI